MERLLVEDAPASTSSRSSKGFGRRLVPLNSSRVELSSNSLEFVVKLTAVFHIASGLGFLLGNIMFLFLMVSYPLHEFDIIQQAIYSADREHKVFHLANLTKKQQVWLLTLSSLYFIMEIMLAKVLYLGVVKRSKSKCQLWLDIHRVVWVVQVLSLIYNMFDMSDSTAAILVYILWPFSVLLIMSIYVVNGFIKHIGNQQNFTYTTFLMEKV